MRQDKTDIVDINTFFGAFPSQHADSTAESLVAQMDRLGVGRALAISTTALFYDDTVGNAQTAQAAFAHQGRLLPVATINPTVHLAGVEEIAEQVASQPFAMCRFFPSLQNWPIDYAPFAGAVKLLAARKKPVMVSIGCAGDVTALVRMLTDVATPIILSRVQGAVLVEAIAAMKSHPALYLETHSLQIPDGLARIKDLVGSERILFGSGAAAHSLGAALSYVQRSSLSDAEKAAILGTNALRLLAGGS